MHSIDIEQFQLRRNFYCTAVTEAQLGIYSIRSQCYEKHPIGSILCLFPLEYILSSLKDFSVLFKCDNEESGTFKTRIEGEEILADSTISFSFEKQHQGLELPEDVSRS